MPKSRVTEWVIVGLATATLGVGGAAAVAFREPLLATAGMEIRGGEPTIAADVFQPAIEPPPPPENLLAPAPVPSGPAPDPAALQQRLDALDVSTILTPEGEAAARAYEIIDVATGETLASLNAEQPLIPASNTKTLTAVAVMNAFAGQERFQTKVVAPDESTIVLVGGGDPLLTTEPVEPDSYPSPASLRDLATVTADKLKERGLTTLQLGYDASWFEGPGWASTWPDGYRNQVTEISALWSDEGRVEGVRSRTPALAAAQAFATQLGELGITVEGEPQAMAASGSEVASVDSLPVQMLVEQAMLRSNNSFTEVLGMQLAKKTGHPTTFEGSTAAIEEQLRAMGLWAEGASLDDASGLSRTNHFSAGMLARVNLHLVENPRLTGILDGLPVAGVTGTLDDRFGHEVSAPARGIARAKTGTLSHVSSLGGTTRTADGAVVVYGIIANGQESAWGSKVWEDQIVGTLTGCGC